ncbi:MAG: methyltransferase type 11, partial [Bacteroidetes bacterium]
DPQKAIEDILDGRFVLIEDFYSTGLSILHELNNYLKKKHPDQSFQGQREFRSEYQRLSHQILVKVSANKLEVKKAPVIGWLEILYPDLRDFMLAFPQVQGLNSAWQWYEKGVSIPVLRNRIHPWYGVYFPSRFEHLQLFDNWLKRYGGAKKSAMDIGIGSGVLSLQLMKHGFQKVYGTDTNPNAIIGLTQFMRGTKLARKIEIDHGHLFAKWKQKTELIVFNPPWLPTSLELERLDEAIYYNNKLFNDFFKEAKERLLPDGKIVLLFSNLAQITNVSEQNPIEKELAEGGRFKKELFLTKTVKPASKKTKRNQNWRSSELVELWVLTHK